MQEKLTHYGLTAGPVLFLVASLLPPPEGLSQPALSRAAASLRQMAKTGLRLTTMGIVQMTVAVHRLAPAVLGAGLGGAAGLGRSKEAAFTRPRTVRTSGPVRFQPEPLWRSACKYL